MSEISSDERRSTPTTPTTPTPTGAHKKCKEDFVFGKVLGHGSYSTVRLAKEASTEREYAIKILNKKHIMKEKKVPQVKRERDILSLTNHPFIVTLYFTFQDKENLFYGLGYESRGDMLQYITKLGCFDERCACFYTAELTVALKYLHGIGVIHRDVKPENILLSSSMHVKLTDFGTAKMIEKSNSSSSSSGTDEEVIKKPTSFVGTAQYVSPEVLNDKVAFKSSDLWALGCIMFQMLSGKVPFQGPNEYFTFQKIIKLDYQFPQGFPTLPKDLISKLLVLNPKERIGCDELGGYTGIELHPFYEDIEFDTLQDQIPPKFKLYRPSKDLNQPGIYDEVDISELMKSNEEEIDDWVDDPCINIG